MSEGEKGDSKRQVPTSCSSKTSKTRIKQDVIKDPRDPACYDCGRLGGGKKGGSSSSNGKLVEPESAAEDEEEGGEEAAVVVIEAEDDRGGQPSLFVAPSTAAAAAAAAAASPGSAPAPAPAISSNRHRAPLAEGGEIEASPLPSSP